MRRQLLLLALMAVAGVIVAAAGPRLIGFVLVGAGIGGIIGEFVQSRWVLPRRAENIYRQQASLRAGYTYSWDESGLSVWSETSQAKRPWSDYIRALESERLLLLYHSDIVFEIFPKAWFASAGQFDEFRSLATRVHL